MNAQDSLRERKKARTRASLREHALRLFREQGYQATTVEQIAAADLARQGVAGGVEVAQKLGSAELLASVRSAFVDGMDIMLWTCGGIALGCALLAVVFLRKLR